MKRPARRSTRSLDKKKRVSYTDKEEEEKEEEKEQPRRLSTRAQKTPGKWEIPLDNLLPVTCGDKEGILDIEKLARGEACIEHERSWFAPPAFEDMGGKGTSKKWKTSIFFDEEPLQLLFEKGLLTSGFRGKVSVSKEKKKSRRIESSSEDVESKEAVESEEDEDWHAAGLRLETDESGEEMEGDEKGGEDTPAAAAAADDDADDKENKPSEGEKKQPWYIAPGYEEIGEQRGVKKTYSLKISVKRVSASTIEPFRASRTERPVPEPVMMDQGQEETQTSPQDAEPVIVNEAGDTGEGANKDAEPDIVNEATDTGEGTNQDAEPDIVDEAGDTGEGANEDAEPDIVNEAGDTGEGANEDAEPNIVNEAEDTGEGSNESPCQIEHEAIVHNEEEGSGPSPATGNTNGDLQVSHQPIESETTTTVSQSSPASHSSIQSPRNPKMKTQSFRRKKTRSQWYNSRDKDKDGRRERRETAMVNVLQNISESQQKIASALEQLCSKQDAVIKLLRKQ